MAKHEVIKDFKDLTDDGHIYRVGDPFPRTGADVEDYRIDQLATGENIRKEVLIELIETGEPGGAETTPSEFPKLTGGGYYELSNGEKVQGKDAAIEAEKALIEVKEGDK